MNASLKYTELQAQHKSISRSKGKRTYVLIILFILVAIGGGLLVLNRDALFLNNSSTLDAMSPVMATIETYYVVQVPRKSDLADLTVAQMKKKEIATTNDSSNDVAQILEIVDQSTITLIEGDPYKWVMENEYTGIVMLPAMEADFRLKTLTIDGVQFWDPKADLSTYQLVATETVALADGESLEQYNTNTYDQSKMFTYVAGGEVIPARAVARKFRRTGDYTFPFHNVQDLFVEADISSILLENTISGSPEPCYGCVWFLGDEAFIEGLEYLGVDYVAFSGNHVGDGGINNIARSIEVMDEAGIANTGASPVSQSDASEPAFVKVKDMTIGFLSYDDVAYYHWAGDGYGGVAKFSDRATNGVKTLLTEKIQSDVAEAKKEADLVFVVLSWGAREYINWPLDYQREAAHAFIDAGVDAIIGTHQHWVGAIEYYEGKPIFYGLGNFVFDQTHTDPTRQGAFVTLYYYDDMLKHYDIIPHQSCGPQQSVVDDESCNHFQPQILEEGSTVHKEILERMYEFSEV